jgi:hypothetical protein
VWEGLHESGVNLDLIRGYKDEDRCPAVIPECAMEPCDFCGLNSLHLLEINERSIRGAESPV